MKARALRCGLLLSTLLPVLLMAQDGDLLISNGFGRSYFQADSLFPGSPLVTPRNLTVGTAGFFTASLVVRGDEMPVNDSLGTRCTFRTDVDAVKNQSWVMAKANGYMGRLWNGANFNWFAIQAVQPNAPATGGPGILYLENHEQDGFMLRANGIQAPVNGYPLWTHGFASIGHRGLQPSTSDGMQNMPSRARLNPADITFP